MIKKYKCMLSLTTLLVNAGSKVMRLEFKPDIINESGYYGCSYSTGDKNIQRAIESNKRFNSSLSDAIWTDDVEKKEEVAPKKAVRKAKKEV